MVDSIITKDVSGTFDLCKTLSTEGKKLRQVETGLVYGSEVIDVIAGMNGDKPFSRYHYVETNEIDEEFIQEAEENEDLQEDSDKESVL